MPPHPDEPRPLVTDLDEENGSWRAGTSGQWDLACSTERLLRSIVLDKDGKPTLVESGCYDRGTVEAVQNESVAALYDQCA